MLQESAQRQAALQEYYEKCLQPDGTLALPVGENPSEQLLEKAKWFNALPHYYKGIRYKVSNINYNIIEGLLLEDVEKINQYLSALNPEEAETEAQRAIDAGFIHVSEEEGEE